MQNSLVKPHLNFGDIIFGELINELFFQMIQIILYKATVAITRAIKRTYQVILYNELRL